MSSEADASFLSTKCLADIRVQHPALVTVRHDATVEDALLLMIRSNVLSLPVVGGSRNHDVIGIINMVDIVSAVVFQPIFNSYNTDTDVAELNDDIFQRAQDLTIFTAKVSSLLGLSQESQTIWMYDWSDKLARLLEAFSSGVHRVLCKQKDGTLTFISQTDVVRYLVQNGAEKGIAEVMSKTVGKIVKAKEDFKEKPVVTLSHRSTALTGFRKMLIHNELTALPIVDDQGNIVATLSTSDLRGFNRDVFPTVLCPVLDFLKLTQEKVAEPVTCTMDDLLLDVSEKILAHKVHRAWIVDMQGVKSKPVGVITLTDIVTAVGPYSALLDS